MKDDLSKAGVIGWDGDNESVICYLEGDFFIRDGRNILVEFEIGKKAKLIYIYLPALESFLISAALASIGIAFKSGIAAEVIGRPKNTLGFFLFDAKVYLETAKVFAITLIVILCSAVFERLTVFIFKRFFDLIKRFY